MEERAARATRPRGQDINGRNADRRLALLKRMGLYGSDMQGARITRATTVEDLLGAYQLVHDIFVQQGYIRPDETGVRIRPFESLPETATFVAKADGRVVGVTSVVIDGPEFGLPTDKAFRVEVDGLRGEGRTLCEGTNWLVAESHRSSGVMTELMRCSFAHALAVGCTDFLGTVSPGHGKFYRLLGFDQPGEVRSYSKEIDDPVVLVRLDLTALSERFRGVTSGDETVESFLKGYYIDDNPYHRHVGTWEILSERLFADPTLLNVLFVQDSRFLQRCDEATRRAIAARWGPGVFQRVWARQQTVSAG